MVVVRYFGEGLKRDSLRAKGSSGCSLRVRVREGGGVVSAKESVEVLVESSGKGVVRETRFLILDWAL